MQPKRASAETPRPTKTQATGLPFIPRHLLVPPDREFWQRRLGLHTMQDVLDRAEEHPRDIWPDVLKAYGDDLPMAALEQVLGFKPHEAHHHATRLNTEAQSPQGWTWLGLNLLLLKAFARKQHAGALSGMLEQLGAGSPADWSRDGAVERLAVALLVYGKGAAHLAQVKCLSVMFGRQPACYQLDLQRNQTPQDNWQKRMLDHSAIEAVMREWTSKDQRRVPYQVEPPFLFKDTGELLVGLTRRTRPSGVEEDGELKEASRLTRAVVAFDSGARLTIAAWRPASLVGFGDALAQAFIHPSGAYVPDQLTAGRDEIVRFLDEMLSDRDTLLRPRSICFEARQLSDAPYFTIERQGLAPLATTLKESGNPLLWEHPGAVVSITALVDRCLVTLSFPAEHAHQVVRYTTEPADPRVRDRLTVHVREQYGIHLASSKSTRERKKQPIKRTEADLRHSYFRDGLKLEDPEEHIVAWLEAHARSEQPLIGLTQEKCVRCDPLERERTSTGTGCRLLVPLNRTSLTWQTEGADRERDALSPLCRCPKGHGVTPDEVKWRPLIWRYIIRVNRGIALQLVEKLAASIGARPGRSKSWVLVEDDREQRIVCAWDRQDPWLDQLRELHAGRGGLAMVWLGPDNHLEEIRMRFPSQVATLADILEDGVEALLALLAPPGASQTATRDDRVRLTLDGLQMKVRREPVAQGGGNLTHQLLWLLARDLEDTKSEEEVPWMGWGRAKRLLREHKLKPPTETQFRNAMERLRQEYLIRWLPPRWSETRRANAMVLQNARYRLDRSAFRVRGLGDRPPGAPKTES